MNLIELLQSKIELFRLEQKYTKRRERRSTFTSDATYVDGEYVYANGAGPAQRGSGQNGGGQGGGQSGGRNWAGRKRSSTYTFGTGAGYAQAHDGQDLGVQRKWDSGSGRGVAEERTSMAPVFEDREH